MKRFSQKSLDFIRKAIRQKKPEWLEKNREEYEDVLVEPTRELVTEVSRQVRAVAPAYRFPTRAFARIKRSADRAKAQGLYKEWIGWGGSRDSGSLFEDLPGLYFHMSPEEVFSAGGLYMPISKQTKQIRAWIAEDASALDRLFEDRKFGKLFKKLGGERKLKTFPRGYDPDHPRIEWLKLTGFYVWRPISKKVFFSAKFADVLSEDFRQVLRLNAVLDSYLASWPGAQAGLRRGLAHLDDIQAPAVNWD
jgi:uncharacterized protein (TIGR02453 family)